MTDYSDLLALRGITDRAKRGFAFEQAIREILPWSCRPPIAGTAKTEQFDAIFEWNGQSFLVECKAKDSPILAGSHDWEDFAFKVERRGGQCIGIFCSLNEVHDRVIEEASNASQRHRHIIVIAGGTWDDLNRETLDLSLFIRFMILRLRTRMDARPPSIASIRTWGLNRETATRIVAPWCQARSATFLRRHRLPRHQDVYIRRDIDKSIADLSKAVRPSKLQMQQKTATHGDIKFEHQRARPIQIAVIKDLSGAGKTTLSVEIASEHDQYFGMARAALQDNIDRLLDELSELGDNRGLTLLELLDRPLVYVIDSLDEASAHPQKRSEVNALFKSLDDLNTIASTRGLIAYPIMLIFTIREDYWREWESQLEGKERADFVRHFSFFSLPQTKDALDKYSTAYGYQIEGDLDRSSYEVLSHPFSLQLFSEANMYAGTVSSENVLDKKLMSLYFSRKKDDLLKRPGFTLSGDILIRFCAGIAMEMLHRDQNEIDRSSVVNRAQTEITGTPYLAETFVASLISEQILVPIDDKNTRLRYRHMRFVEYLVAYKAVWVLSGSPSSDILNTVSETIGKSHFMSMYYVHEFIKMIAASDFPDLAAGIRETYSASSGYMQSVLGSRRLDIALGGVTSQEDLEMIRSSIEHGEPAVCWESFFVLSARANQQRKEEIRTAFCIAWDSNPHRYDRWKLLVKLGVYGLLLDDEVVKRVIGAMDPKIWEVFLEEVDNNPELSSFQCAWIEIDGSRIIEEMRKDITNDWSQVFFILEYTACGRRFPRGSSP